MKALRSSLLLASLLALVFVSACARHVGRTTGRASEANPHRIGALLPLSGPYAPFGEAVKRGLTLAFQGTNVELRVRDSQGDATHAVSAVEELTLDEGAVALIGGLLPEEAKAAAAAANDLGVPLVTLTKTR